MVKLTIDDQEIEVDPGTNILGACGKLSKEIPAFCYHPSLKVAGNCRMCLVEVDKSAKLVASCATEVQEGMVVRTQTPSLKKTRKEILELLLINHPLDCPVCDQAGECNLQEITMNYGADTSRYGFCKRSIPDKYMGPFIKASMNRCIHCTRCVRFANDIAGIQEIGSIGRGENTEIISYLEKAIGSGLSGNMIDICPVGALTSKPNAYQARPWEFKRVESIDVFDAVGSNIYIDVRDQQVIRVMPKANQSINEEWISDKVRFAYDGLTNRRLDTPYVREDGKLKACTWDHAFEVICNQISKTKSQEFAALAGDLADQEAMLALRMLLDSLDVNNRDCRVDGAMLPYEHRSNYTFNSTFEEIEKADTILLIGSNPRHEAPIINIRLRKAVMNNHCRIALIGKKVDLAYNYEHLGDTASALAELVDGSHDFSKVLQIAKRPMVIMGTSCFMQDKLSLLSLVNALHDLYKPGKRVAHCSSKSWGDRCRVCSKKNGLNYSQILSATKSGSIKLLYLLNVDTVEDYGQAFVIYQGHHGDSGAKNADIILPGAAFSEKCATYVNTAGIAQRTKQALLPPGNAKEDWKIIRAISEKIRLTLPFNTLEQLQALLPKFGISKFEPFKEVGLEIEDSHGFKESITNYYMHDIISRNSANMLNAVNEIVKSDCGVS